MLAVKDAWIWFRLALASRQALRGAVTEKRRKLESTVAIIQQRHGPRAIQRGATPRDLPPHISTGFPLLDALTGCAGIPLDALTLLSGRSTSGKLTIAYKTLAQVQARRESAAILDLAQSTNPHYLERCGVRMQQLLIVRPQTPDAIVPALLDLVQSGQLRMLLVDGLPEIMADRQTARALHASLGLLRQVARASLCAILLLDEPLPPWRRWLFGDDTVNIRRAASLHIALQREQWLYNEDGLMGYSAHTELLFSRWRPDHPATTLEITFNGTVRAGRTW